MIMTLEAPAARQGGTMDAPSGEVRLARGLDAPSGEFRLARGLNAPSGEVRLARGLNSPSGRVRLTRGLNAPLGRVRLARGLNAPSGGVRLARGHLHARRPCSCPVYGHLMLRRHRTRATTLTRPRIASRHYFTNSLGEAIPAAV
jgi:hypothetical protein